MFPCLESWVLTSISCFLCVLPALCIPVLYFALKDCLFGVIPSLLASLVLFCDTNTYELLQFPVEINTRGSKTMTTSVPVHAKYDLQVHGFD